MGANVKVSIIVPVLTLRRPWNIKYKSTRPRGIRELIEDIRNNLTVDHELIVIVNSNDADLINYIKTEPTVTKYCINSCNPGVPRSWNIGANLAEGDVLCFSNDDVHIGPGSIERLLAVLMSDDTVGEVGPKGGMFDGDTGLPGPRRGLLGVEEADEISGFFFMVKRSVFDQVGGSSIEYTPAFFEEIDLSFKIRRHGYKCLVVPSDIVHYGQSGVSSNTIDIRYFDKVIDTNSLYLRNKEIFTSKWKGHDGKPCKDKSS